MQRSDYFSFISEKGVKCSTAFGKQYKSTRKHDWKDREKNTRGDSTNEVREA